MIDEVRNKIDELKVHECRCSFSLPPIELLLKSDVIKLVESLTKWNKVEDCLPELSCKCLVKFKEVDINGENHFSSAHYFHLKKQFDVHDKQLVKYGIGTITHWKPLI